MALPCGTTGSLGPTFVSVRSVDLSVRQPSALTLDSRFLSGLRLPSRASVTLWEATAPVKLPTSRGPARGLPDRGEDDGVARVVFQRRLHQGWRPGFSGSHLSYTSNTLAQRQVGVKLHGVFLSCRGSTVSSPFLQFRRVPRRDSAQIVIPFVRVGTYPTRNFATLGPL